MTVKATLYVNTTKYAANAKSKITCQYGAFAICAGTKEYRSRKEELRLNNDISKIYYNKCDSKLEKFGV